MTITNEFFNRLPGTWENRIDGDWQDHFGWNFISQPRKNMPGSSDFDMQFHQMRERIEFREIGIPRNVGITGEAGFWHAMAYEVSIETPDGQDIHHEMGHFLLNVKDESGETKENLRGDVIRQATIPRANAMMTAGELRPGSIRDTITQDQNPFYDARPVANDVVQQARIDKEFANKSKQILKQKGPDMQRPLEWLDSILASNSIGVDWVFEFRNDSDPSQMASGQRVINPVSIGNLLSDFWLGRRSTNGNTIDLLQYAQKVNLIFHGMEWPHVALNTLIKQP